MIYLLLGVAVLAFLLWPRRRNLLKGDGWRVAAGVAAIVAFAFAGYATIRGSWGTGIVLGVLGLWTVTEARRRPVIRRQVVHPPRDDLTLSEARAILGVSADASLEEIKAAYARLIRMAHPDVGGTEGLAAQLNAARDRLIKRRG
ncbi:molecular chaperone DnaJ [Caulobacter segnis]|uniref:Heat shock protein DnaJ domain protein n=2 Tax=Caulobacter segnis TaxID=88688 RepID=D5VL87_CAUST|nr:DnaJ domain-containing protein [Caulobacter segnis]ADG11260.1 heat shock protein DnaJ domain protein [Caulobacter segnis ATCC 21756]AVQ02936.1 molecular chaperone DnaJ [Caulobacter segnis]